MTDQLPALPPRKTTDQSPTIAELAKALVKMQAAMSPVAKASDNPFFKSKYADLADIWEGIRTPLTENGLSIIQSPANIGALVVVATTILHESGEWISSEVGANPKDQTPQSIGSAITYLRRYGLSAMLGVVSDEDDDGNQSSGKGNDKSAYKPKPAPRPPMPAGPHPVTATAVKDAAEMFNPKGEQEAPAVDPSKDLRWLWAVAGELNLKGETTIKGIKASIINLYSPELLAIATKNDIPYHNEDAVPFIAVKELTGPEVWNLASALAALKRAKQEA